VRLFLVAAVLLSLERIFYVWVWHRPESFRRVAVAAGQGGRDPVDLIRFCFYAFKFIQIGVFLGWCFAHGGGTLRPDGGHAAWLVIGGSLIGIGQLLNAGVFYRLGSTGVFYGTRFGHSVPWTHAFPFSMLRHPQYVGTVLSIWGLFVALRFPHPDWYVLPVLETIYYSVGARFES
jgi:hypothetical protein